MPCQDLVVRMPARMLAGGASLRLGRLRSATVGGLAILLWAAGLLRLAAPGLLPPGLAACLVVGVTMLVLPDLTRSLRGPLTLCVAALGGLMLRAGQTGPVLAALDFAAPFAAFLVSIAILRGGLLAPHRLAATRERLAVQDPSGRRTVLLLLSCLLGGVFSIGGFPLLAPLVEGCPAAETDRLASAILCGNALALLWSPFTVAMGFAAAAVGIADGFAFLPWLLAAAGVGLAVALAVHGWPRLAALRQAGTTAAPLLPPFALAIAATAAIAAFHRVQVTDAVVLMAPAIGLIGLLRSPPAHPADTAPCRRHPIPDRPMLNHALLDRALLGRAVLGQAVLGAGGAVRDLPMYIAGFALARALAECGLFASLTAMLAQSGLAQSGAGAAMVLPPLALAMALLGLPALVSGGVAAAAAAALMPLSAPGARLALTLFAWLATTLLSPTGMSVLATASTFGTPARRLIFGRNLLVALLVAALLAATIR